MHSRKPCMGLLGAFSVIEEEDRVEWKDGKCRCCWANPKNERYIRYHDEEWGRPVHDDRKLFEMLVLECFQAGLSWECILNKREAFKQAFDEFELETVCGYGEGKLQELKENAGIVRNSLKISAAVTNARIFRKIQAEYGSFDCYLWHWTEGKVTQPKKRHSSSNSANSGKNSFSSEASISGVYMELKPGVSII